MSDSGAYDTNESVAIIGLAGRFPGARDVAEFWENLVEGRETVSFFSDAELDPGDSEEEAARRQPNYVRARGTLADVEMFDAAFFGINPSEAEILDPQQRIFMETAWEALESSGYDPRSFGGPIGVFAGMSNNYYFLKNLITREDVTDIVGWLTTMMGNEKDYLATRLSYKLDLRGPALNVQTACSTSLVAVGAAVQSLLTYQCDMALAGGVSVTLPQNRGYLYQEGGISSPDGHCRTFDERAAGTVFSNGVGIVTLRRLGDAVQDGDTIYAVIKGVGLNNDGASKVSFTAPSVDGHAEVIAMAHALAGIDPQTISYVEAHGTATPLGDPVEIAGLTQAFRAGGAIRPRVLRDRIGQEQHRASRRSRRRGRPHQDCTGAAPQDASTPAFTSRRQTRSWSSRTRRSKSSVRCARGSPRRGAAPCRRQLVRRRRNQCACRPGGGSGRHSRAGARFGRTARAVRTIRLCPRLCHVEAPRPFAEAPCNAARRRGVHAPDGPTAFPASTGAGRAGH